MADNSERIKIQTICLKSNLIHTRYCRFVAAVVHRHRQIASAELLPQLKWIHPKVNSMHEQNECRSSEAAGAGGAATNGRIKFSIHTCIYICIHIYLQLSDNLFIRCGSLGYYSQQE